MTREKAPIFTMGSADPRSYSRNKRGIAGSLIWINFDRHALLDLFAKAQGRFLANIDDIRPQFRADSQNPARPDRDLQQRAGSYDEQSDCRRHHRQSGQHLVDRGLWLQTAGFALVLRSDPAIRHHGSVPQTWSLHPAGSFLLARYGLENGRANKLKPRDSSNLR